MKGRHGDTKEKDKCAPYGVGKFRIWGSHGELLLRGLHFREFSSSWC